MLHPGFASHAGFHAEGFRAGQNLEDCCIVLGSGAVTAQTENSAKRAADLGYNGLLVTPSVWPEVCRPARALMHAEETAAVRCSVSGGGHIAIRRV
jgi:hypothetical protein